MKEIYSNYSLTYPVWYWTVLLDYIIVDVISCSWRPSQPHYDTEISAYVRTHAERGKRPDVTSHDVCANLR